MTPFRCSLIPTRGESGSTQMDALPAREQVVPPDDDDDDYDEHDDDDDDDENEGDDGEIEDEEERVSSEEIKFYEKRNAMRRSNNLK